MPIFTSAAFYTTIGAGSTHLLSLPSCAWLGWMFRKISLMPPDMNPLKDNLTARPLHKRNKSSVSTAASTTNEADKPWMESRRNSGGVYGNVPDRVSVSFMHTRTESRDSAISMGSRISNSPERKKAPLRYLPRASYPNSYAAVPSREPEPTAHRVSEALEGRVVETWRPSSVASRATRPDQRATNAARSHRSAGSKSYAALTRPYDAGEMGSDSEYEPESDLGDVIRKKGRLGVAQPKPLTSNPMLPRALNARRGQVDCGAQYEAISDGEPASWARRDIADDQQQPPETRSQRCRDSSIQLDSHFDTRQSSGGEDATAQAALGSGRKVSSGNDYWPNHSAAHGRRKVSGKMAEEGRAEGGGSLLATRVR
ncbi:fatty acid elongase [Trichoderma cornu-damae]|uniref:Fatty acid elongase n=1 Tax=Trichoderma cornu-damae TaxID=654480 RepID=A0A9P8QSF3_9HYPO|nr:fatty acid elongase [Trichoderma cornu-damae]